MPKPTQLSPKPTDPMADQPLPTKPPEKKSKLYLRRTAANLEVLALRFVKTPDLPSLLRQIKPGFTEPEYLALAEDLERDQTFLQAKQKAFEAAGIDVDSLKTWFVGHILQQVASPKSQKHWDRAVQIAARYLGIGADLEEGRKVQPLPIAGYDKGIERMMTKVKGAKAVDDTPPTGFGKIPGLDEEE